MRALSSAAMVGRFSRTPWQGHSWSARVLALAAALAIMPLGGPGLLAQAPSTTIASAAPDSQAVAPEAAFRDSTEVTAVARRYAGTVKNCYEQQGLKLDPALRGLLQLELTVLPTGIVEAAAATSSNATGTGMPEVAVCVSTAAREWRFSEGAGGTERLVLEFDLVPPSP